MTAEPGAEQRQDGDGPVFTESDGSTWEKSGATTEQYQIDAETCRAVAQAQVAHDARVESDVGEGLELSEPGLGLNELRGRMSEFERKQRLQELIRECMEAKGYTPR